ncbi:MAG: SlyX family protein [Myxococcota bacterium]
MLEELPEELEERFLVLETKVIYQDRTIDELNGVVTQQQDQIDLALREIKRLHQILSNQEERTVEGGEEPPPPHY